MPTSLSGLIAMKAAVLRAQRGIAPKIDAALYTEAEAIMTASKAICPVDTGVLRQSGFVAPPTTEGNTHRIEMGYGGAASAYAVIVHENPSAHHPVGQWKYLEVPLREAAPHLAANIARRVELDT